MSRSSTSIVSSPTSESLYSFYSTPLSATSIAISKPDHFQSTQEISKLVEADEAMSQFVERSWSNPRAEDETGKTPLVCLILMVRPLFGSHSECPPNRIDLIKLCLSTGVDVNAYDKAGFTALHHLLLKPLLKSEDEAKCVLHLLLEAGADVHLRDPTGGTALHLACQSGLPECTALLIQHITKNPYYYHHHALGVNATNDKGRSVVAEAQRSLAFAQSATESDRIQQCVDQVIEAGGR
jgi:ankyrin repeat protein